MKHEPLRPRSGKSLNTTTLTRNVETVIKYLFNPNGPYILVRRGTVFLCDFGCTSPAVGSGDGELAGRRWGMAIFRYTSEVFFCLFCVAASPLVMICYYRYFFAASPFVRGPSYLADAFMVFILPTVLKGEDDVLVHSVFSLWRLLPQLHRSS